MGNLGEELVWKQFEEPGVSRGIPLTGRWQGRSAALEGAQS